MCYSQALAFAAQHEDVYFFTKEGESWADDSVWEQAEYWPLTREGGPVQRVYRVDPRSEADGGKPCPQPTVIWQRGKDTPREKKWECPVVEDHVPA